MTEIRRDHAPRPSSERAVELRVAPKLENLAVIRTLVGAIASYEDLDLDTVADLRLAIDELCTQLVRSAAPGAMLTVIVDSSAQDLTIRASTVGAGAEVLTPGTFSWHVLTSLVDEVAPFRDGPSDTDGAFGVTLIARRADSVQ